MTTKPKPRKLSAQQRKMAELMANGAKAVDAYVEAGYKGHPIHNSHQITENSGFSAYYEGLLEESRAGAVLTRTRKRELLRDIAEGDREDSTVADAIRAMDQDSKMEGDFAAEKHEVRTAIEEEWIEVQDRAQHKPKGNQ